MSVVNIERGARLSALPLVGAVADLASAGWLVQVRALVVERQPEAAGFLPASRIASRVGDQQELLRRLAAQTLNELVPTVIASIVSAQAFSTLLKVSRDAVANDGTGQAHEVVGMLGENAGEARSRAAALAQQVSRAVRDAEPVRKGLDADIAQVVALLDDAKTGEVKRLSAEIASTSEAMSAAVQAAVDSGDKIAGGTRRLVTWFMSLFSGTGADTPPPAPKPAPAPAPAASTPKPAPKPAPTPEPAPAPARGGDAADGKARTPAADAAGHRAGEADAPGAGASPRTGKAAAAETPARSTAAPAAPKEAFPVETIGEIGSGAADSVNARSELNRLADMQRELYQRLYRAEAAVAVLQAVRQQGADLFAALNALEAAANALEAEWRRAQDKCAPAPSTAGLPFDADWNLFDARVDAVVRSFVTAEAPSRVSESELLPF